MMDYFEAFLPNGSKNRPLIQSYTAYFEYQRYKVVPSVKIDAADRHEITPEFGPEFLPVTDNTVVEGNLTIVPSVPDLHAFYVALSDGWDISADLDRVRDYGDRSARN